MGCTTSRVDASCEEAAMMNGDFKLYYDNHDVTRLYQEFKTKSPEGKISLVEFQKLAKDLPLIYDKNEEVIAFYKHFLVGEHFELRFLATLTVILSRGTTANKVDVLYEIWAKTHGMSKKEFEAMLDFMFDLALDKLPTLASKPDNSNNYTVSSLNTFLERARAGREVSKQALINEIYKADNVEKAEILRWAQTGDNANWLSARYIRYNLKRAGKRELHKKRKQEKGSKPEVTATLEVAAPGVKVTVSEEHHHREHHSEHHGEHHPEKPTEHHPEAHNEHDVKPEKKEKKKKNKDEVAAS